MRDYVKVVKSVRPNIVLIISQIINAKVWINSTLLKYQIVYKRNILVYKGIKITLLSI